MTSKSLGRGFLVTAAVVLALIFSGGSSAWGQNCGSAAPAQPLDLPGARSFTYRTASGRDLRIHVFGARTGASRAAMLFFFGGGWMVGKVEQFIGQAQAAAENGYVAALADYRVFCRDGTSPVDAVSDAEAAYAWLREQGPRIGIDPKRIILSGGSAGGQLAAATALSAAKGEEPAALVLFNPVLSLHASGPLRSLTSAQIAAISPSALPIERLPPTVIFHGAADTVVPIATIRAFCIRAAAAGRRCELHEYEGLGHGFFNSRAVDPALGSSPYDDTLSKALGFLASLGLS